MHSNRESIFPNPLVSFVAVLVASVLVLGACDSAGPSTEGSTVEVGFGTSYSTSGTAAAGAAPKSSHDGLDITGANGTLSVIDIHLIVSEVELEGDSDSAEFEAGPSLLPLPLDTNDVAPLAANQIPPGRYNEFGFEVEDVDVEEDDDDEQSLQELRESIREEFPNWPEGASMVAVGTFTNSDGTTSDFTTFFEAEIKVDREMSTPLEVTGDGLSRSLTVRLDPTRWFRNADGTVRDLSQSDYASTEELVEFEAEFEDGVTEIEVEGDEDDDDDDDGDDDDGDDG